MRLSFFPFGPPVGFKGVFNFLGFSGLGGGGGNGITSPESFHMAFFNDGPKEKEKA